jgi:putative endonuclease
VSAALHTMSNMAGDPRLETGRTGEAAALAVYRGRGYRLLARNWRCPLGELDLVLGREDVVVFCEVKTRRGTGMGGPHEAVTWRKQRKLRALAEAFLSGSGLQHRDLRFDVASVVFDSGGTTLVQLFEQAF